MREKNGVFTKTFGCQRMSALALRIEQDLREMVPRVMARESAKIIAFRTGAVPRSVENWQAGVCLPQAPHLIALARQFPELRSKVLEWLEAETGDSGDDPSRVLDQIAKLIARR